VTGARLSQAARLTVADLQDGRSDPRVMLPSSRKGKGVKRITRKPVAITASLATKLRKAAALRPAGALLLTKANGAAWSEHDPRLLFQRVVEKAGLDPEVVTPYALRHTSITRQLLAGIPIRVVASTHDTSVAMIEKTYSKYISNHSDALTRGTLLDLGESAVDNVVPIHGARA
jgi:integrase